MLERMNRYMDLVKNKSILLRDLEQLLNDKSIDWENFRNKRILITGATGLVGSMIIRSLLYVDAKLGLGIELIAVIRNEKKAESIYKDYQNDKRLYFVQMDLSQEIDLNTIHGKIDYVIHAAAVTTSKEMVTNPVGTINAAILGTKNMLELAVQKKCQGFVYISSMEIYGQTISPECTREEDLGYIDISSVRSCYPEGKRMCECMCNSYASQFGINVKSARLAQTFGAGVLKSENRVFAQFAKSVLKQEDIVLHTFGKSEGNYVYTIDAVKAILMLLYKGKSGEAYNIVNEENHTTIRDMAELVINILADGKSKVVIDVPKDKNKFGYAPDVKMRLCAKKMNKLGWKASVNLKEAYLRLAEWMKESDMVN